MHFAFGTLTTLLFGQILAIQYTPLELDYTDCALILPNRYVTDPLLSDLAAPVHCITYDAINQAYADARRRIDIPVVEDDWKPEEVAAVGQLLLDVAQQLAKEYNLNIEDIELGLPQIDTLKTAIAEICPVFLSSISCRAGRYRRQDGLCNNVDRPTWGATNTPYTRLLPPQFADHVSAPRISVTGNQLPSARTVSRTVHSDQGYHDHAGTMMTVAWGQFMDHDFTLMGTPVDFRHRNEPEECCNRPDVLKNPYCMEIAIPEDDYFYEKFNIKCQDFVRAFPAAQPNCRLGSRTPFNTLTGVIDANTVYGVTDSQSRQLRAGHGGLLKMNPAFASLGLKELLPMKVDIPDEGCTRTNSSQFCFQAGENRVNEQLVLTCIHTLMAREHNRIAVELALINPHWDDEILYQEARRIVIAEIQHITFSEFLPLILGKAVMQKYDLVLKKEGYWDGYNSEMNPSIMDAFASAAFRFGHSLLPSSIERWSKVHKFIASKRLSDVIRRPYDLYRAGVIDEYFMGLLNQVAQAMDDSITQEVTNNLFKKTGNHFGLDLVSFNIQRGRDFGLPGYMYFRKHCGLRTADTFVEMFDMMPNSTIYRYMTVYEHPWDIDLWSGGVAEHPLPGSMVGPTFACIIAMQMNLLKQGDRFWYELPNQPSSFTPEQLQEIRKVKLSRVLCDNTDLLDTVQIYSMVLPDHEINPRVPCKSSVLPKLDLSHWIDKPARAFEDTSANSSTPLPLYAYHIKTVAIIEGANPALSVNDLLTSPPAVNANNASEPRPPIPREDSDYAEFHKLNKRDTFSSTATKTKRYAPPPRPRMTQAIMKHPPNGLRSRSSYDDGDVENFFRRNVPVYGSGSYNSRTPPHAHAHTYSSHPYERPRDDDEEESDREQSISVEEVDPELDTHYEEVPMMMNEYGKQKVMPESEDDFQNKYSFPTHKPNYNSEPYNAHHFHHRRPSFSDGRVPHSEHYTTEHHGPHHHSRLQFPAFHHQDDDRPYKFEHQAGFRSHDSDSFAKPPKYGTSHQYNSLADQQPRFYKHFVPAVRAQQNSLANDEFSHSNSFGSGGGGGGGGDYNEESSNYPHAGHDFPLVPPTRRPLQLSAPYRTSQVPQTLEEYHRLHNSRKGLRPPPPLPPRGESPFYGRAAAKPKVIPNSPRTPPKTPKRPKDEEEEEEKDDKEDEDDKESKEDKDDYTKPFVSMNFQNFNLNDHGISIKHQIPVSRANSNNKFQSFKPFPSSDTQGYGNGGKSFPNNYNGHRLGGVGEEAENDYHNAFPNVPPKEGSVDGAEFEDPDVVKAFVTSMFNRGGGRDRNSPSTSSGGGDAFKDFLPSKPSSSSTEKKISPFNPHFGERVRMISKPAQNFLWHRKANEPSSRERGTSFRGREKSLFDDRNSNFRNQEKSLLDDRNGNFRSREKSLLDQENAKIFDILPTDFNFKQSAKRDADFRNISEPVSDWSSALNATTNNPYVDTESTATEEIVDESEFYTTSMPVAGDEGRSENHSYEHHSDEIPVEESTERGH